MRPDRHRDTTEDTITETRQARCGKNRYAARSTKPEPKDSKTQKRERKQKKILKNIKLEKP